MNIEVLRKIFSGLEIRVETKYKCLATYAV
jgi:hypothetical protein